MRRMSMSMAAAGAVLILTGCASAGETGTVSHAPASSAFPSSAVVTDQESCEAFGDVSTILQNANIGLHDGRMTQQEYAGWLRLATRVLDRVPTSGKGAVSESIATLKELAPAIPAGTTGATGIGNAEWYAAAPLADACSEAGAELSADSFTGG